MAKGGTSIAQFGRRQGHAAAAVGDAVADVGQPQVAVLAAVGNPYRFEKGSQVLRLAGYDLGAKRSGKTSEGAVPVISKKGKAELRYALYQAALVASTRNKYFMLYYANKLRGREKERGIKTKMRVKLAAKMLLIAWTLMKKRRPFDPTYLNLN